MSQTRKNQKNKFDDEYIGKRKTLNHANNSKTQGIKIINQNIFEENDDQLNYEYKYDYEKHTK